MYSGTVNLSFDETDGIAQVTFNRPDAMNAFDISMADEFKSTVKTLQGLPQLRCVVLRGNQRAFIAGGDVAEMLGTTEQAERYVNSLLDTLNPALISLRNLDAPIIAGVQGVAAGAGLSVALMADLIIADANATFLLAYDGIGAVPDCGASWALPNRIGAGRASELMLLGSRLNAEQAYRWGLVNEVTSTTNFDEIFEARTKKVASGPTKAYAVFRRLMEKSSGVSLAEHMEREKQSFLEIVHTSDFSEGVSAFLEKRRARFIGQ